MTSQYGAVHGAVHDAVRGAVHGAGSVCRHVLYNDALANANTTY